MKKLEVGIVGLGKFGLQLGKSLVELGHTAIGIDARADKVRLAQDFLSKAYEADATDIEVLKQLRFAELDTVAVSVGYSMESSILVCLNLQEIGISKIIAKASSQAHAIVLKRLGVKQVILPEADVAMQLAHKLHNPGLLDVLPVGKDIVVQEIIVNKWAGKTLIDLDLMTAHKVLVLAIKKNSEAHLRFVPAPSAVLSEGDKLVVIGNEEAILKLEV